MDKKSLDILLKKFSPKAYELAFSLVPDDLQASQIVVDACTSFLLSEYEWLKLLETENMDKQEESELKKDFYLYFMKSVFSLGMKRFSQLPKTLSEEQDSERFYQLDGKTRALVFLKYKENLSVNHLVQITTLAKSEVMSRLFQAMELLGTPVVAPLRETPPELPLDVKSF